MSLKAVEMQIALPRTMDAGQLQDQLQQRGQSVQNYLSQEQLREEEVRRNRVNILNETEGKISRDVTQSSSDVPPQQKKSKNKHSNQALHHPFLGARIDFNG
jgi:hypothetical protein